LAENFETIKAIGMGVVVFKISKAFIGLALAISRVRIAMIAFDRVSKTTIIGLILGLGVAIAETTGALEKMFNMFKKEKGIEDFRAELDVITDQFELFSNNGVKGFDAVKESYEKLRSEMKNQIDLGQKALDQFNISNPLIRDAQTKEIETLTKMITELDQAYMNVPLETIEVGMDKITKSTKNQGDAVKELTGVYANFQKGFTDAFSTQKDMFQEIQDIGRATFEGLKQSLTDFVMTGKLSFQDLSTFIVRKTVEMLIGQAIQSAFDKGMALFKADAIKKAMISLYEGAMKTFASIPFPFNIVAVGGALAFGAGIINKIRGFEKGGRPPVGRPSIVGEKGAELFVPDQAGTVVPNDKLGMGKNVTVNFNINTVDARGFNELLVNSRGVIVNLINSAMNEKGRMAVI
jgi:phage-related minor tail protein